MALTYRGGSWRQSSSALSTIATPTQDGRYLAI